MKKLQGILGMELAMAAMGESAMNDDMALTRRSPSYSRSNYPGLSQGTTGVELTNKQKRARAKERRARKARRINRIN